MVHGADALLREELGEEPHHHLAVFQHVRDARGRAQVVLEHVVLAVGVAHDVHARHMRVDSARHVDAHHLAAELRVLVHLLGGNLAGLDDLLGVVDVVQEAVQRGHALSQSPREDVPLARGDHVRNDVERNQPLGPGSLAIHGERDADAVEEEVRGVAVLRDARLRGFSEPFGEGRVMTADRTVRVEHLVVELGLRHGGCHRIARRKPEKPAPGEFRGPTRTASSRLGPRRHQPTDDAGKESRHSRGALSPQRGLGCCLRGLRFHRGEAHEFHTDHAPCTGDAPIGGGAVGEGGGEVHERMVACREPPALWWIRAWTCRIFHK